MSGQHEDLIVRLRRLAPSGPFPDILTEAADALENVDKETAEISISLHRLMAIGRKRGFF